MGSLNLGGLTAIPAGTGRSRQPYDLRYLEKSGRFRVSNNAFISLGLGGNLGLTIHRHQTGAVLVSIQAEENSTHMKRRGDNKKGKEFTNRNARKYLDKAGFSDSNDFALKYEGQEGGSVFYRVVPWDGESTVADSPNVPTNSSDESYEVDEVEVDDYEEEDEDEYEEVEFEEEDNPFS